MGVSVPVLGEQGENGELGRAWDAGRRAGAGWSSVVL